MSAAHNSLYCVQDNGYLLPEGLGGASHGTMLPCPSLPVMSVSHEVRCCVQDNGYLHPESWEVLQVTAWIPLLHATKRNGCMQVLKGGHRAGKTCKHSCCVGGTW